MCQFTNHSLLGKVVFRVVRMVREGPATTPCPEETVSIAEGGLPAEDLPNLPTAGEADEESGDTVGKSAEGA